MLINVHANEATKKQVEIRLHTYPHLVANVKNRMDQGAWVIVAMLGDFYLFDGFFPPPAPPFSILSVISFFLVDALQIFSEWSEGTRGPIPRLAKGFVIWEKYRDRVVNDGPYPRRSTSHYRRATAGKHVARSNYRQGSIDGTRADSVPNTKGQTRWWWQWNRKTQAKIKRKFLCSKDGGRRLWQMLRNNLRVSGTR